MYVYDTLTEALESLKQRGFTEDLSLHHDRLECAAKEVRIHPEDFTIVEVYRFEGMSNPDDSSVVYAIESKLGLKGTLVDAYGTYAENMSEEMINKLKMLH